MTNRKSYRLAILALLATLAMLLAMLVSAMPTMAAHLTLPEVGRVSAATSAEPVPYDGVPVTPKKIDSKNYRIFGLDDETWGQYNGYYAIRSAKELYGFADLVREENYPTFSAVLLNDIVIGRHSRCLLF